MSHIRAYRHIVQVGAIGFEPIGAVGRDELTAAHMLDDRRRNGGGGFRPVRDETVRSPNQAAAHPIDRDVGGRQMLVRAIGDGTHAFGDHLVLLRNAVDAAIGLGALHLAIDKIIVVFVKLCKNFFFS